MKSYLCLVIAVLLVDVTWAQDETNFCLEDIDVLCRPKNVDEVQNREKTFPDETMLNRHCDGYVQGFQCLVDYEKRCLQEGESLSGPGHISIEDIYSFVKDVCDRESSIGKGYRRYADCFNTDADNIKMCFRNSSALGERFKEHLARENINITKEEYEEIECTVIMMSKTCSEETIKKSCGQEASRSAIEIFNRSPYPLEGPLCTAVRLVQVEERFSSFLAQEAKKPHKK